MGASQGTNRALPRPPNKCGSLGTLPAANLRGRLARVLGVSGLSWPWVLGQLPPSGRSAAPSMPGWNAKARCFWAAMPSCASPTAKPMTRNARSSTASPTTCRKRSISGQWPWQGAGGADAERAITQVKAVDNAYPLVGEMQLDPPMPLAQGRWTGRMASPGGVMEPILADRLGLADW